MSSIFIAGQGESLATSTIDYPRAERLVNGNPQRLTQNLYEHPNMSCGLPLTKRSARG